MCKPPAVRRKPKASAEAPTMNKRAQDFPSLVSQALSGSHLRVIGHPAKAKAEVETAGAERLSI